jgi:acyl carrier protein
MQNVTGQLIAILARYVRNTAVAITSETTLADLDIDLLDIPMIFLDVEDQFDVQVECATGFEDLVTVGDMIAAVLAGIEAKQQPRQRTTPRKKSNWMSTSARA